MLKNSIHFSPKETSLNLGEVIFLRMSALVRIYLMIKMTFFIQALHFELVIAPLFLKSCLVS